MSGKLEIRNAKPGKKFKCSKSKISNESISNFVVEFNSSIVGFARWDKVSMHG